MKKYSVKKRMELLIKIAQAASSTSAAPSSSMTPEQKSALVAYMSSGTLQNLSNDQLEKLKGIISTTAYDAEKKRRDNLKKQQDKPKPITQIKGKEYDRPVTPAINPATTFTSTPQPPSSYVDSTPW